MRSRPAALAACLLLAGCAGGTLRPMDGEPAYTPSADASSMQIRRIGQWTNSGIGEPRRLVIRDATNWQNFWSDLDAGGDRPAVDFTRETVIAVAAGGQRSGGYDIRVDHVELRDNILRIEVIETVPGPNCITTTGMTQPVDVVVVPAAGIASWSFVERREVRDCR